MFIDEWFNPYYVFHYKKTEQLEKLMFSIKYTYIYYTCCLKI